MACAVIVKDFRFRERVDDSKKLTAARRERAFGEILKKCFLSAAVVEPRRIDEVNILRAALEAMRQAVTGLAERPTLVLVDGPAKPKLSCETVAIPGGDALSFSIACASIAAKVIRDRLMHLYHERFPSYGFDVHKGYGTAAHFRALFAHGPSPIHRFTFGPVRRAQSGFAHG